MLKSLFNFKLSKPLLIAKILMLICFAVAIAIAWMGLVEIVDMPYMKEVLNTNKPLMGDVLVHLLKKYLGWALLIAGIGGGAFLGTRFHENNKAA